MLHPLQGQLWLCLLPRERGIADNGPRQEKHPAGQGDQLGPAIPRFLGLKARLSPAQDFFAKMDACFHRPAGRVCPPQGFKGEDHPGWDLEGSQPGLPESGGWLLPLDMHTGSDDIIGHIDPFLFMQSVPTLQMHLAQ